MTRFIAVSFGVVAAAGAAMVGACSPGKGGSGGEDAAATDGASDVAAEARPHESGADARANDGGSPAEGGDEAPDEEAVDASLDGQPDMIAPDAYPIAPYALVRFANFSPDAPAVDVCTAPHGTGRFSGPVVAGLLRASGGTLGEAGSSGLVYPLVSSYVNVPPGANDIRFVSAGATNCQTGVAPDATTPSLVVGAGSTVALLGALATTGGALPSLQVATYGDEIQANDGPLRVRFINAAPAMALAALGTGSQAMGSFTVQFPAVPFGLAAPFVEADANVPSVDPSGYRFVSNFAGTPLSTTATGSTTDAFVSMPVYTQAGIPVTIVAIGGAGAPIGLVECLDSGGGTGALGDCWMMP